MAHYTHGAGLVSQVSAGGTSSFYDFDLRGSTVGLTNAADAHVNTYSYLPFGGQLTSVATVANPFQFVGRHGVVAQAANLHHMDARYYDSVVGQFISDDPIGLDGADTNLRRYVNNDPVTRTDSRGLLSETQAALGLYLLLLRLELEDLDAQERALNREQSDIDRTTYQGLQEYDAIEDDIEDLGEQRGEIALLFFIILTLFSPTIKDADYSDVGELFKNEDKESKKSTPAPAFSEPPNPCEESAQPLFIQGLESLSLVTQASFGVCTLVDGGESPNAASMDPNEKIGPKGFGAGGFVLGGGVFPYRVNFENDKDAAAPAQQVRITDQLSTNLNWDTFEFTDFGFGDEIIAAPEGSQSFQAAVPITFGDSTFDVLITADFFSLTGQVVVLFQSIDPATELPPDVLLGFLPPEDGTGRGQGHFSYLIEPKSNLPTGTQIKNIALITFDSNLPIATNQIDPHDPSQGTAIEKEALNTIDIGGPTSSVTPLTPKQNSSFKVKWDGADDAGGSGIATYDVFVSENNGPYTAFQTAISAKSAVFTGAVPLSTYRFYAVATDNVGHVETIPATADTQTVISNNPWQNAQDNYDTDYDESIAASDVLAVINYINANGSGSLPGSRPADKDFVDSTGDKIVAADDVIKIINFINANPDRNGEASSDIEPAGDYNDHAPTVAAPPSGDLYYLLAYDIATNLQRRRSASSLS